MADHLTPAKFWAHPECVAFVKGIREQPTDRLRGEVFADWLDERGTELDIAHANAIRYANKEAELEEKLPPVIRGLDGWAAEVRSNRRLAQYWLGRPLVRSRVYHRWRRGGWIGAYHRVVIRPVFQQATITAFDIGHSSLTAMAAGMSNGAQKMFAVHPVPLRVHDWPVPTWQTSGFAEPIVRVTYNDVQYQYGRHEARECLERHAGRTECEQLEQFPARAIVLDVIERHWMHKLPVPVRITREELNELVSNMQRRYEERHN